MATIVKEGDSMLCIIENAGTTVGKKYLIIRLTKIGVGRVDWWYRDDRGDKDWWTVNSNHTTVHFKHIPRGDLLDKFKDFLESVGTG